MTTRQREHLVTGSYFRPRNKDGGHAIRSAVVENPMLHVRNVIDAELYCRWDFQPAGMPICAGTQVSIARILDGCRPFCSFDLDLDPMTFVYELDTYCLEIHGICKYELTTSRLSKVIVRQTYIQTYRYIQTEGRNRPKL